jgi:two-component system phosphate regulon sensor histidine kinase PhoR
MALLWYSSSALDKFYLNRLATELEERAYLIEEQVTDLLLDGKRKELEALCRKLGRKASTRITVINPFGVVIADSDENSAKMGNHSERPEIKSAMSGATGSKLRFSATLGHKMLYVAIPLEQESMERGQRKFHVLRLSMPASTIGQTLQRLRLKVAVSGIIVALFAMLAAIIVARKISKPLEKMKEGAEQFARENFSSSLSISSDYSLEAGALATAMNSMAKKLRERFDTIVLQRNELQTILASMGEAILVIDNDKKITTTNTSASSLLGFQAEKVIGCGTQEVLRNITIQKLVDATLAGKEAVRQEVVLKKEGEKRFLQYSGVRLFDGSGKAFGAVLAFNDLTHIRSLENVRRDFVANVSHELMTPLTSIKGYAETILDNGPEDKEQTEKFLRIILRQANRLQAIVNDLLDLSLIEKEMEQSEIQKGPAKVKSMLEGAIQVCKHKAAEKDITIQLDCPDDLMVPMSAELMEQACINLLVNAVKYSEAASRVEIEARLRPRENAEQFVAIRVRDYGVGISREHLPRLFERFYRSDKARSRKLGGTGLGLAIVKHIVQAHNGRVEVESEVGRGTVFTMLIPGTDEAG